MITSITAKRHMETNWRCPLLVGRLSVLCRAYCSRCTMARRRSRLALSPTISCATRCPPHQSFDCYCCSHFFRPLLDHQSSPSSQIDRLRCSLPKATRSSRQLPAAPFMTNARILCFFLHKFSGPDCHL